MDDRGVVMGYAGEAMVLPSADADEERTAAHWSLTTNALLWYTIVNTHLTLLSAARI